MQTKATLRNLRIAPRKVRLVADLIRRKKVSEAQTILQFVNKSASESFQKIIHSAVSSAAHSYQIEKSNLYIANIIVDEGSKLKRWRPRARGRAYPIQKKTSHITVVLGELVPSVSGKAGQPAESPKGIQAGPPSATTSKDVGGGGKPKFRYEKKSQRPKLEGVRNKIFRRKAI